MLLQLMNRLSCRDSATNMERLYGDPDDRVILYQQPTYIMKRFIVLGVQFVDSCNVIPYNYRRF